MMIIFEKGKSKYGVSYDLWPSIRLGMSMHLE
jgi:hypothetical protein